MTQHYIFCRSCGLRSYKVHNCCDNPDWMLGPVELDANVEKSLRAEKDPTGVSQHDPGAKLDDGKTLAGVLSDFSLALIAVAEVGTFGAKKYSRGGWQSVANGIDRYSDAMWRHLLAERHDPTDPDSGLLHAAHLAWNTLSRLELMLRKAALDDDAQDYHP